LLYRQRLYLAGLAVHRGEAGRLACQNFLPLSKLNSTGLGS
jgi:hypothetical protein